MIVSNEFYLFFKCMPTYVTTFGFKIWKFHYFFIFIFCSHNIKATLEHSKDTLLFLFFHMHQTMTYDIRYTIYKGHRFMSLLGYRLWFLHLKNAIFSKDTDKILTLKKCLILQSIFHLNAQHFRRDHFRYILLVYVSSKYFSINSLQNKKNRTQRWC